MTNETRNIIDIYLSHKYKPFYIDNILKGRTWTRVKDSKIQGINYLSKKDLESIGYSIIYWARLEGGGRFINHEDSVRVRFEKDALKWLKKHNKAKRLEFSYIIFIEDGMSRLILFTYKQIEEFIKKNMLGVENKHEKEAGLNGLGIKSKSRKGK